MIKQRKALIWCIAVILTLGIILGGCVIYVNDYYKANPDAVTAALSSDEVDVKENSRFTAFIPKEETHTGFIFYPGGKVEHKAYYPLMHALAEQGILSIVVQMPLKLAVLDANAALEIKNSYSEIESWYVGGHSLGGSMAASCTYKNENEFNGVVLLGAYSTKDLSKKDVAALSVYGTLDGVMNKEKYANCLSNMPTNFKEFVIDGGNHAYFGSYGEQKNDGEAIITPSEQISITTDQIVAFISLHG